MTATNTDFINQILSSTVGEKGVEGVQGMFKHAYAAWSQRWSRPGQL
jgi:hypothetical protein